LIRLAGGFVFIPLKRQNFSEEVFRSRRFLARGPLQRLANLDTGHAPASSTRNAPASAALLDTLTRIERWEGPT
jgi:hypothetical protein